MIKLYKNEHGILSYWETWKNEDNSGIIHFGMVGEKGKVIKIKPSMDYDVLIPKEVNKKANEGYHEIDDENQIYLEIQYLVRGFGTEQDINKRHRLEDRMNETLGWTGLGHCDGGSIGSGMMEVGCIVVDFDIAERIIKQDLARTEFDGYHKIVKIDF